MSNLRLKSRSIVVYWGNSRENRIHSPYDPTAFRPGQSNIHFLVIYSQYIVKAESITERTDIKLLGFTVVMEYHILGTKLK